MTRVALHPIQAPAVNCRDVALHINEIVCRRTYSYRGNYTRRALATPMGRPPSVACPRLTLGVPPARYRCAYHSAIFSPTTTGVGMIAPGFRRREARSEKSPIEMVTEVGAEPTRGVNITGSGVASTFSLSAGQEGIGVQGC